MKIEIGVTQLDLCYQVRSGSPVENAKEEAVVEEG